MRFHYRLLTAALILMGAGGTALAQVQTAGEVRRRSAEQSARERGGAVRMRKAGASADAPESGIEYQRDIYRRLDLTKGPNAALYYPEDVVDGQKNLFRLLLERVASGDVAAYEYLDGREVFTDEYKVKPAEMLERFGIPAASSRGGLTVADTDVPAGQVEAYYIIEKWQFDNLSNSMKTSVWAVCPVLTRTGDYGETMRYPMFWARFDDLRPYLVDTFVFPDDDNNLARYSLADFFALGLYNGEIYKTKNLRNLSMQELYPDDDERKLAQDSIDKRLRTYGNGRWAPTREEFLARQEAEKAKAAAEGEISEKTTVTTKEVKKAMSKKSRRRSVRKSSGSEAAAGAERSVRRRKR